jgi:hypothetical protein
MAPWFVVVFGWYVVALVRLFESPLLLDEYSLSF